MEIQYLGQISRKNEGLEWIMYLRMDRVNLWKTVFQKFYLVYSGIFCPRYCKKHGNFYDVIILYVIKDVTSMISSWGFSSDFYLLVTNLSCWETYIKIYYHHSQFLNLVLRLRKTLIKLPPLSILQHMLIFQLLVCYYHQLSCPFVRPDS